MLPTYKAILPPAADENRVEWLERPPKQSGAVRVHITILEDSRLESTAERGKMMADALAELARRGAFAESPDPVAWQRDVRADRALSDRVD